MCQCAHPNPDSIDFHLPFLPFAGCDAVSGVQWLQSLGQCMCSFIIFLTHPVPPLWSPIFNPCKIPNPLRSLLATYTDVFYNPRGLHPHRSHDHHITLTTTKPVHVRRYSHHQKSEIESQIPSMLSDRIILLPKARMPHLLSLSRNMMTLAIFVLIIRALNSLRIKDH